jgi:hypothetical protein
MDEWMDGWVDEPMFLKDTHMFIGNNWCYLMDWKQLTHRVFSWSLTG